ncbi:Ig-like domain-containing protein [Brevibacillus choshinensis]|uniref:Ig-like domain-containing protein n=1 Tax=Brevibacillus choshinensis TaxID=54911 RepID=A0ABX7FPC4_BRECH|nr:Ig-like domain-containing protein [Brevibacillus choshinensis]QRG67512.1 Ig-like domain-containing protein [Brevibacillus choshinensis]
MKKIGNRLLTFMLVIAMLMPLFQQGALVARAEEEPLDQSMAITNLSGEPVDSGSSNQDIGQSFTAGRSGSLTKVAFYLKKGSTGLSDITVNLYQADGAGLATSNRLGQAVVSGDLVADDWDWVVFTFPTPIPVSKGQRYAAVMEAGSPVWVGVVKGSIYKDGVCLVGNSAKQDTTLPFWTYVAPEARMDQSVGSNYYQTFNAVSSSNKAGQSFIPSQSGYLTKISLFMVAYRGGETDDMTVTLRTVNQDGTPSEEILAQTALKGPVTSSDWREITFPSPPLVEAGKPYAIVLTSSTDPYYTYAIAQSISEAYENGRVFYGSGSSWHTEVGANGDLVFRTYVEPLSDTHLPSAILSMTPNYSEQATLNIVATDSGTASSGIKQVSYRINGGDIQSQAGDKATISITEDGYFLVEYWPEDNSGKIGQSYFANVHVDNKAPIATLTLIEGGVTVKGKVPLKGTVSDSHLLNWVLSFSEAGKEQWTALANGTNAVAEDLLTVWNTDRVSEGDYDVRLLATDRTGKSTASTILVHVKREATAIPGIDFVDLAWPTVEGAVNYDVTRGDDIIVYSGPATSYKHEGLSLNTEYTYNIYANFPGNISILWTTLSAKTRAGVPVTRVTLNKPTLALKAGGATGTLHATIQPENATNKTVSWSSSDPRVASVDNGVVTPLKQGTATITARTQDGGYEASAEVTVSAPPVTPPVTPPSLSPEELIRLANREAARVIADATDENTVEQQVSASIKRLSDLFAASKLKQQTELDLITDTADTVFAAMMDKWSQDIGDEDLVLEQTDSLLTEAFLPVLDDIATSEHADVDKTVAALANVLDTVIAKLGKHDVSDKWADKLGETMNALLDKVGMSESDDRHIEDLADRIERFASAIEKIETSLDDKASRFELEKTFRIELSGDLGSRTDKRVKRTDVEQEPFATLSREVVKASEKNRINLAVSSEGDGGVRLSHALFEKHGSDAFTIYLFERDNLKTPSSLAHASDQYQFGLKSGGEEISQFDKGSVRITLPYDTKSKYLSAYRYDEAKKSWKLLTTSNGKSVDVKKKGKQASFDIEQTGIFLVADTGVQSISVTPKRASLLPGEKLQLTVTGKLYDRSQQDLTSEESGTVYASNSGSITVDQNGLIQIEEDANTGKRASITVKNGNKSAKVSITVATVKSIAVTAKKKIGETGRHFAA